MRQRRVPLHPLRTFYRNTPGPKIHEDSHHGQRRDPIRGVCRPKTTREQRASLVLRQSARLGRRRTCLARRRCIALSVPTLEGDGTRVLLCNIGPPARDALHGDLHEEDVLRPASCTQADTIFWGGHTVSTGCERATGIHVQPYFKLTMKRPAILITCPNEVLSLIRMALSCNEATLAE